MIGNLLKNGNNGFRVEMGAGILVKRQNHTFGWVISVLIAISTSQSWAQSQSVEEKARVKHQYKMFVLTDVQNPKVQKKLWLKKQLQMVVENYEKNPRNFIENNINPRWGTSNSMRQLKLEEALRKTTDALLPEESVGEKAFKYGSRKAAWFGIRTMFGPLAGSFFDDLTASGGNGQGRSLNERDFILKLLDKDIELSEKYPEYAQESSKICRALLDFCYGDDIANSPEMDETLSLLLGSYDREEAIQENREKLDSALAEFSKLKETRKSIQTEKEYVSGVRIIGYSAEILGDTDFANKSFQAASILETFFELKRSTEIGTLGLISGYMGLSLAAADLVLGSDQNQESGFTVLASMIDALRQEMNGRFDRLEEQVADVKDLVEQNNKNIRAVYSQLLQIKDSIDDLDARIEAKFARSELKEIDRRIYRCNGRLRRTMDDGSLDIDSVYACVEDYLTIAMFDSIGGALSYQPLKRLPIFAADTESSYIERFRQYPFHAQHNLVADHAASQLGVQFPKVPLPNMDVWLKGVDNISDVRYALKMFDSKDKFDRFWGEAIQGGKNLMDFFYANMNDDLVARAIIWRANHQGLGYDLASRFLERHFENQNRLIVFGEEGEVKEKLSKQQDSNLVVSCHWLSTSDYLGDHGDLSHGWSGNMNCGGIDRFLENMRSNDVARYMTTDGRGKIDVNFYINNQRNKAKHEEYKRRDDRERGGGGGRDFFLSGLDQLRRAMNVLISEAKAAGGPNQVVVSYTNSVTGKTFELLNVILNHDELRISHDITRYMSSTLPGKVNEIHENEIQDFFKRQFEESREVFQSVFEKGRAAVFAEFLNPADQDMQNRTIRWRLAVNDLNFVREIRESQEKGNLILTAYLAHTYSPLVNFCPSVIELVNQSINSSKGDSLDVNKLANDLRGAAKECDLNDDYVPEEILMRIEQFDRRI